MKKIVTKILNAFAASPSLQRTASNELLAVKYRAFQNFLELNDQVHQIMTDVKEKLSGDYLFDRQYLKSSVSALADKILSMLNTLDILSQDKYKDLYARYLAITRSIAHILSPERAIPPSGFVLPLADLSASMTAISGGKIAHLGEIRRELKLPVPDGFSITAAAFKRYMDHNGLTDAISERIARLDATSMDDVNRLCGEMRNLVLQAELPSDLQKAIRSAVDGMGVRIPGMPIRVSVRSSAVQEDGDFTFAGQYATFLNVVGDDIEAKYKEVIASLFTPHAVFYYKAKGLSDADLVMPVGVLSMVDAKAGGVIYSRDPVTPDEDTVIINAVHGLGKAVVDGIVAPSAYRVDKQKDIHRQKTPAEQAFMLVCTPEGALAQANISDEMKQTPCLSDEQVLTLTGYARDLERYYKHPQDVEWALDHSGCLYILQSRPLKIQSLPAAMKNVPRRIENHSAVIDTGVIACKGIGCGPVFIARDARNLDVFPSKGVLVAAAMATDFVVVLDKASAVIIDTGSITGHLAALAREFQVPMIVHAGNATSLLKDGQEITVDAVHCNVYEGRIKELLAFSAERSAFKDTHLFRTLEQIVNYIAPLNLVAPDAENFRPECCATYHDITRFAHEKAMAEMFLISDDPSLDAYASVPLKAGIPMDARLIDLGGGLSGSLTTAGPGDILSVPFTAFLKGMSAMRWPEPRQSDVKGFLGMIANTAAIPEAEIRETATRSYAVLSSDYMNFSIRLGYHFSMVEAYIGSNMNENYIKFIFRGGGAATDRRLRRIRLISEILQSMGFRISARGDSMEATLMKYGAPDMEKRLMIMGKLTAYTKQLDMVMYNDAVTDLFIEDFVRDHVRLD